MKNDELVGKSVNFTYRGKGYSGIVTRKNATDVVLVEGYEIPLQALLSTLREDSKLDSLAKSTVDTLKGDPSKELDVESLSNNANALENIRQAVKVAATSSTDPDIKDQATDDKATEEATKKALAATKVEQDKEKGTVSDTKAAEDSVKAFLKDNVLDEYSRAKEKALKVSGADLVDFVRVGESEIDEDADYLDSEGEPLDDEPTYEDGDNESLGLPDDKREEALALAKELLFRGQDVEDVAEFVEMEYETSRDEAASIVQLASKCSDEVSDVDEDELEATIDKMNEADKLNDVLVSSGTEVTDEWDRKFEDAIDEFEASDTPYSSEDLFNYLYQKFGVPEEEAVDILKSTENDVPRAVVALCERCKSKA